MPERKYNPRDFIPNSTQVPNVVLDWLMAALSGAETKVLLFFIRQRYGFQKFTGKFSYTIPEIQTGIIMRNKEGEARRVSAGTGLGKDAVFSALATLEKKHIVSVVSRGRRKVANSYRLTIPNLAEAAEFIGGKTDLKKKLKAENQSINPEFIGGKSDLKPEFIGGFSAPLGNQVLRETKNKIAEPEKTEIVEDAQGAGPKGPGEAPRIHHPSKAETDYATGYAAAMGQDPIMTGSLVIRINKLAKEIGGDIFAAALPGFFRDPYARAAGFPIGLLQANPNKYISAGAGRVDPLIESGRQTAAILRGERHGV